MQGAAIQISPACEARGLGRSDAMWLTPLALIAGLYAVLQFRAFGSGLPVNDAYFGADVERILGNLVSADTNVGRTALHPLFPFVGVLYRMLQAATGLENTALLQTGAFACGAAMASLTYVAARVWGATSLTATAAVALVVSSAAVTYWTSLPETHIWGGMTTLACIILARFPPRDPILRELWSSAILVLSMSMLITNGLLWGLVVSRLVPYSPSLRLVTTFVRRNFASLLLAGLAGLGILLIGFSIERVLLHNNPTMGYLFFVGHERKWVLTGRYSDLLGGLHAMGVIAPTSDAASAVANLLGAVVLVATLCLIPRQPPRLRLMALFLPLAFVIHSLYDRPESFLCSPNYVGVWAVLIAVGVGRERRGALPMALIAASILLGIFNTSIHMQSVSMLQPDQIFQPD